MFSLRLMLFSSYLFILVFLPITLGVYVLIIRRGWRKQSFDWLVLASLFFYGWWKWSNVPLLLGSLVFNYAVGTWLGKVTPGWRARALLTVGLAANLLFLGYFKYANFFVENANTLLGLHWTITHVVLPLGISFYTFQKIGYRVDSYHGLTRGYGFRDFCLFVSFFPQLIAGPIVHHSELMPQFRRKDSGPSWQDWGVGTTLFVIGLAKKVLVADPFAGFASPVFDAAAHGMAPGFAAAWIGTLASTMQIYFDFSGYSDMAIGLARLFEHRRFLAAVAYNIVPLSARLSLHSPRRQSQRPGAALPEPDDHDAAGRAVARRRLDVCRLGRVARGLSLALSRLARLERAQRTAGSRILLGRRVGRSCGDVPRGGCRLGVFSRREFFQRLKNARRDDGVAGILFFDGWPRSQSFQSNKPGALVPRGGLVFSKQPRNPRRP